MTTVRIRGMESVMATLRALPPELIKKNGGPIRKALRKAAVVFQEQARANVRGIVSEPNKGGMPTRSTGNLERAISVKRRKLPSGLHGESYTVGISKIKMVYADTRFNRRKQLVGKTYEALPPSYYAWFLEFGTERMRPHPFMRPAFEEKKEQAILTFTVEFIKELDGIVKKLQTQNRAI